MGNGKKAGHHRWRGCGRWMRVLTKLFGSNEYTSRWECKGKVCFTNFKSGFYVSFTVSPALCFPFCRPLVLCHSLNLRLSFCSFTSPFALPLGLFDLVSNVAAAVTVSFHLFVDGIRVAVFEWKFTLYYRLMAEYTENTHHFTQKLCLFHSSIWRDCVWCVVRSLQIYYFN